jgi:protein kinase-like protein
MFFGTPPRTTRGPWKAQGTWEGTRSVHPAIDRYIKTARQTGLITDTQFDRAKRRIRSIARDMPAGDAIWTEALRAEGALNRHQAEALADRSAEPGLVFNGLILLDKLDPATGTWLALHGQSGRRLVVKRLVGGPGACKPIRHPHLVRLHQLLKRDAHRWMVTEFVEGASLAALIGAFGRLPADVVIEMARQVAAALAELHKHGVHHQRLDTRQVLIGLSGEVKISDYGLGPRANGSTPSAWLPRVADLRMLGRLIRDGLSGRNEAKRSAVLVVGQGRSGQGLPADTPERLVQLLSRLEGADGSFATRAVVQALGPAHADARAQLGAMVRSLGERESRQKAPKHRLRRLIIWSGLAALAVGAVVGAWLLC